MADTLPRDQVPKHQPTKATALPTPGNHAPTNPSPAPPDSTPTSRHSSQHPTNLNRTANGYGSMSPASQHPATDTTPSSRGGGSEMAAEGHDPSAPSSPTENADGGDPAPSMTSPTANAKSGDPPSHTDLEVEAEVVTGPGGKDSKRHARQQKHRAAVSVDTSALAGEMEESGARAETPRKILVILHGKRADDPAFREGVAQLKSRGHMVKVRVTYAAGDVEAFVRDAMDRLEAEPFQTLVAAGGDGTLAEVVAAYVQYKVPPSVSIALVPYGTCNDFASANGISQDPIEALQVAASGDTIHKIDVGLVNGQVFMNTAACGVGCGVDEAEAGGSFWKRILGPTAVALTGVKKLLSGMGPTEGVLLRFPAPGPAPEQPPPETLPPSVLDELPSEELQEAAQVESAASDSSSGGAGVEEGAAGAGGPQAEVLERVGPEVLPGVELVRETSLKGNGAEVAREKGATVIREVRGDLLLLAAGNSRQMARTLAVTPDAMLDDGLLDVTVLMGSVTDQLGEALRDVFRSGLDRAKGRVQMMRVPWIEVESPEPLQINCDGEPVETSNRVRFEVLQQRVPMHLPDDRMLASGLGDVRANPPKVSARRMVRGKLKQMLTDIKAAPGGWKRKLPHYKRLVLRLTQAAGLVAVGWLLGWRQGRRVVAGVEEVVE